MPPDQVAALDSPLITALIAALVALVTTLVTTRGQKSIADSNRAWIEYEVRRDLYAKYAELVSALYEGGDINKKPELHIVSRQIRLIGSDKVVTALTEFTESIKSKKPEDELKNKYQTLFLEMRHDLRTRHSKPPTNTNVKLSDFPLES